MLKIKLTKSRVIKLIKVLYDYYYLKVLDEEALNKLVVNMITNKKVTFKFDKNLHGKLGGGCLDMRPLLRLDSKFIKDYLGFNLLSLIDNYLSGKNFIIDKKEFYIKDIIINDFYNLINYEFFLFDDIISKDEFAAINRPFRSIKKEYDKMFLIKEKQTIYLDSDYCNLYSQVKNDVAYVVVLLVSSKVYTFRGHRINIGKKLSDRSMISPIIIKDIIALKNNELKKSFISNELLWKAISSYNHYNHTNIPVRCLVPLSDVDKIPKKLLYNGDRRSLYEEGMGGKKSVKSKLELLTNVNIYSKDK